MGWHLGIFPFLAIIVSCGRANEATRLAPHKHTAATPRHSRRPPPPPPMATVAGRFGSPPPLPLPRLRRRATFSAGARRSAARGRITSSRNFSRMDMDSCAARASALGAESSSSGGGGGEDASEIIDAMEVKSSSTAASFLAKVALALGVAATATVISLFMRQPSSGPSFSLPQIVDASALPDAAATIGYTFSLFGKKVIVPEYTPGWVYFWLLMAAGFGLFISEEALNVWVGISLARSLCLDGTWQSLANSFSMNASYIISTVLWVYWQTRASEDISSKGIPADCYFAGVCCGCLFTLPIQLAVGFFLRERSVVALASVAAAVPPLPPTPAMAGRLPAAASAAVAPLPRALLLLAALALFSLTFLSLRSLRPAAAPPSLAIGGSRPSSFARPSVYHSAEAFAAGYAEMERSFKVYIYPDGDPKTFYQTPRKLTGKYASEGYFFQNIRESRFRTGDPDKAHLFFVPISPHKMRGKGTSYENMTIIVKDYVEGLINKYPYWNRTLGADHFFVTCHDVGVRAFEGLPFMVKNSIRVVCSPSYNVDFIPHKDISLPQVLQPFALPEGGNDVENRTILGFWAGHRNSKIRVILARVWENDTELAISNNRISRAIGELVYQKQFYRTKFCICPGGSQVNSARISDSIHYGCVPDYYDLPFNDILDWRKFAVVLKERDVYQLKSILKSISQEEFVELHKSLVQVQKHFVWHSPPLPYDAFHMVMYELWLRHHVIKY
uniref:Exostosin GT47 domain-containing protein n=1 Tax=Oryza meridionalis TaxID=40149 RepID=A0A0E0CGZ0_9ORYZ